MKVPEHVALSFLVAQLGVQEPYGWTGTALVIAAGCLPDLDGLTIVGGRRFYQTYHRIIGHGVPLTVAGPLILALIGWLGLGLPGVIWLWLWLQIAVLAHLFTDVCFYNWPVQVLWPWSSLGLGFGLVAWNDLVPTFLLYGGSVLVLLGPLPTLIATGAMSALLIYLGWRTGNPRPETGWIAWLTGDWAKRAAPFWRWLTGDFVT